MPDGYALDNADSPPRLGGEVAEYHPTIGASTNGKMLVYKRRFLFGGGDILFPVEPYPLIKTLFDILNKSDNHTITLKQTAATAKSN